MISALLDIVAPRARARLEIELNTNLENFLSNIKSEHFLIESNQRQHKFRVNGDSFADLKAAEVITGKSTNPEHYGKIGFNLIVENNRDSKVVLKAEERVVLGYLEIIAISSALEEMLTILIQKCDHTKTL